VNDFNPRVASINEHDHDKRKVERHSDDQMALLALVLKVITFGHSLVRVAEHLTGRLKRDEVVPFVGSRLGRIPL
jgi:hypothetical protein